MNMYRDISSCNTYNYGDALYRDTRYVQEGDTFDWYQRYVALCPFVRKYIPTSFHVLMVGCGNAHMQMDVRDMSVFPDEFFDGVIDKGNLDSLMCGSDALISATQMLSEVSRLLKPRGTYVLVTYDDPKVRMPHLRRPVYNWEIELYVIRFLLSPIRALAARPSYEGSASSSLKSYIDPIPTTKEGLLPPEYVMEDPDSHFIYVCEKKDEVMYPLASNIL